MLFILSHHYAYVNTYEFKAWIIEDFVYRAGGCYTRCNVSAVHTYVFLYVAVLFHMGVEESSQAET